MNSEISSKLNQILRAWPMGTVVTQQWLKEHEISQQLAYQYQKSHWLKRIGQGAFIRVDDEVNWQGGLYALQEQLQLPIHIGAKSALELQGYSHFLSLKENTPLILFGEPGIRLPAWFIQQKLWKIELRYYSTNLFSTDLGIKLQKQPYFSIKLSAPERAILELLYLVPQEESLEEAYLLMEGLTTLRPALLQTLLEQCNSIKVKRLFMCLAEQANHHWFTRLNTNKIDFGKGKRVIGTGGYYNSKYQLSLPKFLPEQDSDEQSYNCQYIIY